MAKMNAEQTKKFNELFETAIGWGDDDNCIGLFDCFGGENEFLATCTEDGYMQLMSYNGGVFDVYHTIPINGKTKSYLKRLVSHLIDGSFDDFEF